MGLLDSYRVRFGIELRAWYAKKSKGGVRVGVSRRVSGQSTPKLAPSPSGAGISRRRPQPARPMEMPAQQSQARDQEQPPRHDRQQQARQAQTN